MKEISFHFHSDKILRTFSQKGRRKCTNVSFQHSLSKVTVFKLFFKGDVVTGCEDTTGSSLKLSSQEKPRVSLCCRDLFEGLCTVFSLVASEVLVHCLAQVNYEHSLHPASTLPSVTSRLKMHGENVFLMNTDRRLSPFLNPASPV